LTVVLIGPPITLSDVGAALASLQGTVDLPREPKGTDVTWRASEQERGYHDLRRDYPDDSDDWKRDQ
jgi:hypothetical protein